MADTVKDFILTKPIAELNQEHDKPVIAKKKPSVEYTVLFATGTDFAVRKKTAKTSQVLAIIVSQNQFYIKNESGGGTIESLTLDALKKFTASIPDEGIKIIGPDGGRATWIESVQKGSRWADGFLDILCVKDLVPYMKYGMFDFDLLANKDWAYPGMARHTFEQAKVVFDAAKEVVDPKDLIPYIMRADTFDRYARNYNVARRKAYELFTNMFSTSTYSAASSRPAYDEIYDRWGVEGVRAFVRTYMNSPVIGFPTGGQLRDLFAAKQFFGREHKKKVDVQFALQNFVEYMFCNSAEQGFAEDFAGFIGLWSDYLGAQNTLYGKIEDKYPEHLASDEKILAYRVAQISRKVDEENWKEAVHNMRRYEWSNGSYKIICPKTQEDLVEEGRQMAHCVGSYAQNVADGNCMIFFLRRANDPLKSLVTIQIRSDGSLGQVRAKFNRNPKPEHMAVVDDWYEKIVLKAKMSA